MALDIQTTVTRDDETGDVIVGEKRIAPAAREAGHGENLADVILQADLDAIGIYAVERADADKKSRSSWEEQNARAISLLGIGPESEPSSADYPDGDTSEHPLLLSAITRFQSAALSELLPPEKVCTGVSAFDLSGLDKKQRGQAERDIEKAIGRVEEFYLDYTSNRLPSYEEDTDLILYDCGMLGVGIRKVYVDPTITSAPVRADYVPLEDLFISYKARSTKCGRITHRMFVDASNMVRLMQAGIYRAVDVGSGTEAEEDAVTAQRDRIQGIAKDMVTGGDGYTLYEVHTDLFIADDPHPKGLARPYVITIDRASNEVLAIRRNWVENDPDEKRIEHFIAYTYHPGKSAVFALGLGALLANPTEALRNGQRNAMDAGKLANHPAGFKRASLSIREDNTRVMPGEFVDIDSPGAGPLSDSIMLHPFKGPDRGLMELLDKMEANGKELGGVATADLSAMMGPSVAPGPALAAYEDQTKFQSAVHRRLYRAHKSELRLMHSRMRELYANKPVPFGINQVLQPTDLILVDLLPAMDPAQITRARRMIQSQIKLDTAEKFPDILDKRAAVIDFLNATGVDDVEHMLLPEPQEAKPLDPVSEYGQVLNGLPVKAGPAQNHMAHIDAHTASMQGLQSSSLPVEQGALAMAAFAAHIAEHMALDLAVQISSALGIPMETLAEGIPPEVEFRIAPMMASAIAQIEQARAGDSEEDIKVTVARITAENRLAVEKMKGDIALAKEGMESEQNRLSEEAQTGRNTTDGAIALLIAGIRGSGAGVPNTNPVPPRNDINPDPRP